MQRTISIEKNFKIIPITLYPSYWMKNKFHITIIMIFGKDSERGLEN